MKKVNKDPFSNGDEHFRFEVYNCNKCVKSCEPRYDEKHEGCTHYVNQREDGLPKCSIQRDIVTRMFCNEPINERTVNVCDNFTLHGIICPYQKTKRKKYIRKNKKQTEIELYP